MKITKSQLKQIIKEELESAMGAYGPQSLRDPDDPRWKPISGEASTTVGALERFLTDTLEDYKDGHYKEVAADLKKIAFEIEQMMKHVVHDPQRRMSLPGTEQDLASYEDIYPTK